MNRIAGEQSAALHTFLGAGWVFLVEPGVVFLVLGLAAVGEQALLAL